MPYDGVPIPWLKNNLIAESLFPVQVHGFVVDLGHLLLCFL